MKYWQPKKRNPERWAGLIGAHQWVEKVFAYLRTRTEPGEPPLKRRPKLEVVDGGKDRTA